MYRCQSAHKLVELDAHFRLFSRFRPRTVVDLAAAPGGFAQVALQRMQNSEASAKLSLPPPLVIAVDQRPIEPLPGLVTVRGNILQHQEVLQAVRRTFHPAASRTGTSAAADTPRTVEMVLHDGVSVVKGQHAFSVTYAQNQMALSTLLLACKLFLQLGPSSSGSASLKQGRRQQLTKTHTQTHSSRDVQKETDAAAAPERSEAPVCFVSKVLRSPHFSQVLAATNALFRHVSVFKPQASRAESSETYLVATHFLPHHWHQLLAFRPDGQYSERGVKRRVRGRMVHSAAAISPALFSMPPAAADCNDTRHIVWNCLGCGRTCMGVQPCVQCGTYEAYKSAGYPH